MTKSTAASKDRRLGKGLAALLGEPMSEDAPIGMSAGFDENQTSQNQPSSGSEGNSQNGPQTILLEVDQVETNPFQPRREFNSDEIASLAESIKSHQQLQPILVRIVDGKYQLISGERRLRATMHAGLKEIRAEVRQADDRLVAELAIIENLQRKDLNPIEKALSFKRYIDEHHCRQDDLAKRLSIDRSTIANLMRLLELPESILDLLQAGKITAGHARALLPIGEEDIQIHTANKIMAERISVRATENLVASMLKSEADSETGLKVTNRTRQKRKDNRPQIEALQQDLRMVFGSKVEIKANTRGRGKLTIHFSDNQDFERILAMLNPQQPPQLKIAG